MYGAYHVPAAKNAVLPILAATVGIEGRVVLDNCPRLSDVDAMLHLLNDLGACAMQEGSAITVDCSGVDRCDCNTVWSGCMRSSLFLLGSVLGRMRHISLGYPGGCVIGSRPIDIHLSGLRAFGVTCEVDRDRLVCHADKAHAAHFRLPYPSVGATVNLVQFAISVEGESVLENIALEPEIGDMVSFLKKAGADITEKGNQLVIEGGKPLHEVRYKPIGDRMVAATLLVATAMVGGEITLHGASADTLKPLLDKIENSSCIRVVSCDTIRQRAMGRPVCFSCKTGPYPAFATDMQSLALAHNSVAKGVGVVAERVFESRFALAKELGKMGARIDLMGNTAIVHGTVLHAAETTCCDLRAGAALVLAALTVDDISKIYNIGLIDRGYMCIEGMLSGLGADITRIDER